MTEHRNVAPKTEVSTNFYGSVTGIVDNAYIQAHGGGGVNTNAVLDIVRDEIIPATNRLDKTLSDAIDAHVENKSNPHAVTAEQVGALPLVNDIDMGQTAVTIGSRKSGEYIGKYSLANGEDVAASGRGSHAEGTITTALGSGSHTDGFNSRTREIDSYAFSWNGDITRADPYESHGEGTFNINPAGGLGGFYIGEQTLAGILTNKADKSSISATDPTFSNSVLAVGLNIDTNSVAVLNDIAATFGGFPIEGTATTVGGLLAALAAAIAWLKKNKVGSFASVGGATATVENGVAKLDDFFTNSNSLLNGRLAYSRNETGLKDRAFNTLSFDGTEFNLSTALAAVTPTASGQPRDLLIVATATAATTISFTAGTIKGDKPTIDGAGTWLITLTEYAANTWYCRQIKMEDAA